MGTSPMKDAKIGVFSRVIKTEALQVGALGAPLGVQWTNLISSGLIPGNVVLR